MTTPEARPWRDAAPEQFAAVILAAAEQLGVLPLAVEKDYWVCEALRAISLSRPGEVIFKGGTSLEKLRIIKRFPRTSISWSSVRIPRTTPPRTR